MDLAICERCGSPDFIEKGNERICVFCRTKYALQQPSKCADSSISVRDDVQNLLKKCKDDPRNAKKYAALVLDIDPHNFEAMAYLGFR